MTGDGDRLFPVAHCGLDRVKENRGTEDRTVKNCTDGAVRTLPHFREVILLDTLLVRGDGGAFDGHTVFFVGISGVKGHLVTGALALGETEVVILGFEINEGKEQLVLDLLPKDSGHFVAVHFNERRFHCNFGHDDSFPDKNWINLLCRGEVRLP